MQHHTDFPRKYVVPIADGLNAVHQFLDFRRPPDLRRMGTGVNLSVIAILRRPTDY
jgi:hypothetical protein